MTGIYTPTREDLERRVARFDKLQPMSTARDLGCQAMMMHEDVMASLHRV